MYNVLLIDDEPFIRKGLSILIDWEKEGFIIKSEASDGKEALELIKNNHFDLIICDIKMPEMNGIELLEHIRENEISSTPFVFLSGYFEYEYVKKAIRNQCADYILKPVEKEELLNVLQNISKNIQKEKKITAQNVKKEIEINEPSILTNKNILSIIENEIFENYSLNLSLKNLSEKYYINSAYLGQLFKKNFGCSFKDYLNNYRIEKACEFLTKTDKKVYFIAQQVGYNNFDYFVDRFVNSKGCTPTKYRNRINLDNKKDEFN